MTERSIKAKNLTPLSYKNSSDNIHFRRVSFEISQLPSLEPLYAKDNHMVLLNHSATDTKVIWSWMSCWTASFVDVSATSLCLWSRQSWRTSINQTVTEPRARSWACPVTFVLAPLFSFVWCHLISFFKFNKLWRYCKMNSRQWEYL